MGRTSDADQRLMEAALSLIWEQSYGATTVDVICLRADVKKGSFYYFFDSKSDLAVAALDRYWQDQKPVWDEQFSPSAAPLERIQNHCDAVYRQQVAAKERSGRVPGCPFCTIGSEICQQDEPIRAKICEILDNKIKYWETAISDAQREGTVGPGDPVEKAKCAAAYFEGLLAQSRLHNNAEMLASLGSRVLQHIIACSGKGTKGELAAISTAQSRQETFDSTLY